MERLRTIIGNDFNTFELRHGGQRGASLRARADRPEDRVSPIVVYADIS